MKYLLLIYADETISTEPDSSKEKQIVERYQKLAEELQQQGVLLSGERLTDVDTATSVRVREGQTLVSDGPFAETKEQLGGFFLVDCKDLDHALEVAAQIPSAELGTIEVRPLWYQ